MKKSLIGLICLSVLLILASCTTTGVGKNYQIPSDSDFSANRKNWDTRYYVDKFDTTTNSLYIITKATSGLFSNSVTRDSECAAELLINENGSIEVFIDEYGRYPVQAFSTTYLDRAFSYRISNSKGEIVSQGTVFISDRFVFKDNDSAKIIDALCRGGDYKFVLTGGQYVTRTYKFVINGSGCAGLLKQFFPVAETKSNDILYL